MKTEDIYKFISVWKRVAQDVLTDGHKESPRGKPTLAKMQNTICVDMRHPVLLVPNRKLSYQFMAAEAYWILSGDDTVASIEPYNKHIAQFSDDGERFFGAYGPKIVGQLDHVVNTLVNDPDSRQAGITIWRENPPKTKDVPCTVAIFASLSKGQLNLSVYMRSSDVWLGLPYDVFTFSMLAHLICCRINDRLPKFAPKVYVGHLYLTAANQHIYESNLDEVNHVLATYHTKSAFDLPVPNELCESEDYLFSTLFSLRDSKPGDAIRWWEKQEKFDIVSDHGKLGTNYQDIQNFHNKFGVPTATEPSFLGTELYGFRSKFMQEELDEFQTACAGLDMEGAADALIDLVYVAMGTADMMGLPWQALWDEVQRANMSKVRAERAEQSARGTAFDVIKPAGWEPPDHCDALIRASSPETTITSASWPVFTGYPA